MNGYEEQRVQLVRLLPENVLELEVSMDNSFIVQVTYCQCYILNFTTDDGGDPHVILRRKQVHETVSFGWVQGTNTKVQFLLPLTITGILQVLQNKRQFSK